jgi:hypothetical protein
MHTNTTDILLVPKIIGVDSNDRETRKIEAWLEMAEQKEGEATLPLVLEIPTICLQ